MRMVSTRQEATGSKLDVDPNHETSVSMEEFDAHKEGGRFLYTWTEPRGKDVAVQWGIPGSTMNALMDGKKVILVVPAVHRQVAAEMEKILGAAFPVRVLAISSSVASILTRLKANPSLFVTSSSISLGLPPPSQPHQQQPTQSGDKLHTARQHSDESSSGANSNPPSFSSSSFSSTNASSSASSSSSSSSTTSSSSSTPSLAQQIALATTALVGTKIEERLAVAKKRLAKMQSESEPVSPSVVVIDNDKDVDAAFDSLLSAIGYDPNTDFKSSSPSSSSTSSSSSISSSHDGSVDLKTCDANEYLRRTVLGSLMRSLEIIDAVRPSDPIEYLALSLLRDNQLSTVQNEQLREVRDAELMIRKKVMEEREEAAENGRL